MTASDTIICPQCGLTVRHRTFCAQCGSRLPTSSAHPGGHAVPTIPSPTYAPGPAVPPVPPAQTPSAFVPSPPSMVTSEPTAILTPSPANAGRPGASRRRRRAPILIISFLALVAIAAGAVGVAVLLGEEDQERITVDTEALSDDADTPPDSVPVGAIPASVDGGFLAEGSGTEQTLTAATCPGLRAVVDLDNCVEVVAGESAYGIATSVEGSTSTTSIFLITTANGVITARPALNATVDQGEIPAGARLTTEVFSLTLGGTPLAIVTSTISGGAASPSTVAEIVRLQGAAAEVVGVVTGGRMTIAVSASKMIVASEEYDDTSGAVTAQRLYTMYPGEQWQLVEEVLDQTAASTRLSDADALIASTSTSLDGPPRATTTSIPAGSSVSTSPGTTQLSCDGSFIAIVASRPADQVPDVLSEFPGSRATENISTCASLNPTFAIGSSAGEPIWVIYFGPYTFVDEAQQQCLDLGFTSQSDCFIAPLTDDPADRTERYGPLD